MPVFDFVVGRYGMVCGIGVAFTAAAGAGGGGGEYLVVIVIVVRGGGHSGGWTFIHSKVR